MNIKNEINGLVISTIFNTDRLGYETAIIDKIGAHPVERYSTKNKALEGHSRWLNEAISLDFKNVEILGYEDLIQSKVIVLHRKRMPQIETRK